MKLLNKTVQYNIHIFDKVTFFKCRTTQVNTTETIKNITYLN